MCFLHLTRDIKNLSLRIWHINSERSRGKVIYKAHYHCATQLNLYARDNVKAKDHAPFTASLSCLIAQSAMCQGLFQKIRIRQAMRFIKKLQYFCWINIRQFTMLRCSCRLLVWPFVLYFLHCIKKKNLFVIFQDIFDKNKQVENSWLILMPGATWFCISF